MGAGGGGRSQGRAGPGRCRVPAAAYTPGPGMEVAAYLTEKAHSVSVVELEETPFRRFLGERVGRALMKVSAPWPPAPQNPGHPAQAQTGSHRLPTAHLP